MRHFTAAILTVCAACATPRVDVTADKEQIARNIADWKELAKSDETDKILTYFADDIMIFPAGQPVVKGRVALRRQVESRHAVETRNGLRRTTTWDVQRASRSPRGGDTAYVVTGNFRDDDGREGQFGDGSQQGHPDLGKNRMGPGKRSW